jgi:pyruvate/2-oxoacid:ferredoxin oxidoreductase beta subunit
LSEPNGNGAQPKLTAKDYKTDQEVRWCPGCGDYAILAALQGFMPELEIPKERIVFVSGIGCAARFPYYMETYDSRARPGDSDGALRVAAGPLGVGCDGRR